MKAKHTPSVERLREMLCYDPSTGLVTWREKPNRRIKLGDAAGRDRGDGYVEFSLDGCHLLAHRVAWALMRGAWPDGLIDHRDRNPSNNRWSNLREGNKALNAQNTVAIRSRTGFRGVSYCRLTGRYTAAIKVNGKRRFLGRFHSAQDAGAAYEAARIHAHPWRPQ